METVLQTATTGGIVLVDERKPELSYRFLEDRANQSRPILCVTREPPERVARRHPMPTAEHHWLISGNGNGSVNPNRLDALLRLVDGFVQAHSNGAVILDGIELLMIMNSYEDVRAFLCSLQAALLRGAVDCLIPIDTRTLTTRELAEMRTAFPIVRGPGSG